MTPQRLAVTAAWISFICSTLIMIVKFVAYFTTHSQAVLSDAVESIVNVIASLLALFVMRAVAEPADEEHPYGHGKLEYFSAAFEGGLIAFAAIAIAFNAIEAMIRGSKLFELETGMMIVVATAVLNLILGLYLRHTGKKYKSEALNASAAHVLTDVLTSLAVFVGLLLVKFTGLAWIDGVVALIMAASLFGSGYKIVRKSIGSLIDEKDHGALVELAKAFDHNRHLGVIDIHQVKTIRSGRFHHVDAHLVVPEFWDISHAHKVMETFEEEVIKTYPYDGEIAFHLDPCDRTYCRGCDFKDCAVRRHAFEKYRIFTPQALVSGPAKEE